MHNTCFFKALVISALVIPLGMGAQNLVPNPGFEVYRNCPKYLGNFQDDVAIWDAPTEGSTDYFHLCSQHMGTPDNFNGAQKTFEGKGYAGFYAWAPGDYREYLQVKLKSPLREGAWYRLSFNVSLAERSDYAIRDFGVLFSNTRLSVATKRNLSRAKRYAIPGNQYHYLEIRTDDFHTDTSRWVPVATRFQAKGTEEFLILGNFRSNRKTRIRHTRQSSNKGAYYYLDLVELLEETGGDLASIPASGDQNPEGFRLDSLQVFRSLLFEFDTYRLSTSGREELDSLYRFLQKDPSLELHLAGHTDATGTPGYNQRLSELRCQAVAEYLQDLGIQARRIRWQGFGDTRPVAPNDTESRRGRNRRVEFVIRKAGDLASSPED